MLKIVFSKFLLIFFVSFWFRLVPLFLKFTFKIKWNSLLTSILISLTSTKHGWLIGFLSSRVGCSHVVTGKHLFESFGYVFSNIHTWSWKCCHNTIIILVRSSCLCCNFKITVWCNKARIFELVTIWSFRHESSIDCLRTILIVIVFAGIRFLTQALLIVNKFVKTKLKGSHWI